MGVPTPARAPFPRSRLLLLLPSCRRRDGLVLIINPQYRQDGNVVSDLGFLPW